MQLEAWVGFGAGVLLIYLVGYLLMVPGRYALRLLLNAALGGLGLIALHLLGPLWGLEVGLNAVTALAAGFLGIPGVVLLAVLRGIL